MPASGFRQSINTILARKMWAATNADNARFGQLIVTQTEMTVGGDDAYGLSNEGSYLVQCDIIVPCCNCVFNGE